MATEVDVCNASLVLIGDSVIESLDDLTDRAIACHQFYERTRDAVLRAHPWNFALVRAALVLDAGTPAFKWAHQFTLPSSPYCLRVLEVDEDYIGQIPWEVEGRLLMTDESSMKIRYIARILDPTAFDSLFFEAFAARLASQIAFTLRKEPEVIKTMWDLYQEKIQEAKTIDGMEKSIQTMETDDLISVRH